MMETYLLKIFYLLLIRKGLATEKERDEIFSKLQYGMPMEEVYKVFEDNVKTLEKNDTKLADMISKAILDGSKRMGI